MKLDLAHGSQLDPAHLEEGGHGGDQHAQVGHGQAEQVDVHHTLGKQRQKSVTSSCMVENL